MINVPAETLQRLADLAARAAGHDVRLRVVDPETNADATAEPCDIRREVLNHQNEVICELQASIGPRSANDSAERELSADEALRIFDPIADLIADTLRLELNLREEIDELTEELTERYEELNLVFDTQDQVEQFQDTGHYLQELVSNCIAYLGVDFCALTLPRQRLFFVDRGKLEDHSVRELTDHLNATARSWNFEVNSAQVVNSPDDDHTVDTAPKQRRIKVPILRGAPALAGLLMVARDASAPPFTNSDRNLLEAMARKVAKIMLASYDSMTGLVTRAGFEHLVECELRSPLSLHGNCILYANIDRTQVANDTHGTDAGDLLIQTVADSLRASVRLRDIVARLGGDEFGILLTDCALEQAGVIARKIHLRLAALDFSPQGLALEPSVSIGIAAPEAAGQNVEDLINSAKLACNVAKQRGSGQFSIYRPDDINIRAQQGQAQLVASVQEALRHDRFALYAQPILPLLTDGEGVAAPHAEVLLRMIDAEGNIILPGEFLPAAETYQLMPAIDRWVVSQVINTISRSDVFERVPGFVLTINMTGQSLSDEGFLKELITQLNSAALPPRSICIEITETMALSDFETANRFIAQLHDLDVLVALDDFGTGLSSFEYLKRLDLDYLKIDGVFVKDICKDPVAATMVKAINEVAHAMDLKTVGEFVVDEATADALRELEIDYGQGFALGKPMPLELLLRELSAGGALRDAS
ncbi:MAG: EAL domain-containing protein [Pseudomonadota bacterium]